MRVETVGTAQITPPLPGFGYLYAADQKASFRRGFLRLGMRAPTQVNLSRLLSALVPKAAIELLLL